MSGGSRPAFSVAVIVPTFNRAAYINDALGSILSQTVPPDRILVIDDGSTDATAETVASFGARIEYLHKTNGGKSSALNLAMAQIETEFVWIFDDDDVAAPHALERLLHGMRSAPDIGFSYGSYEIFTIGDDGARQILEFNFPSVPPEMLFIALLQRSFVHQPGLLVRRSCYAAVGPFDETLRRSQDYDMMLRLARRFRGVEVPGPIFFQRQHAGVRGAAGFEIGAAGIKAAWTRYDQVIMRRLRETSVLEDFLPHRAAAGPLVGQERFSALLERSTAFGHAGLWEFAAEDLREAVSLANAQPLGTLTPSQGRTLDQLFDLWSDAESDFRGARPFRRELRRIASPILARQIRSRMSSGLPYRIRDAASHGRLKDAARLTQAYLWVATPSVIAVDLIRKVMDKLSRRAA